VQNILAGASISAVSARTGVSVATLRSWEERFGFPQPARLAGGHRRYDDRDVEHILRVLAERARGQSLPAAIRTVLEGESAEGDLSIFAGLRRLRPDLPVHVLSRRAMLAVSHAIEDESRAQGQRLVLVAAFQREAVYRRAQTRWLDLARTARFAVVFADFAASRRPDEGPDEVALPRASPLRREWAVICAAPEFGACLSGWERPRRPAEAPGERLFEATWSVEPKVVHLAASLGLHLARQHAPELYSTLEPLPDIPPEWASSFAQSATALTNRIVAYLDR
jgi:DICT domain-containing protein/predicted DNA-binding transcriptional regulator AlpA